MFIFLSTLVHEIPTWTFLTHFWVDDVFPGSQNFNILRKWFRKRILHFKFFFNIDFHLSITIGTWHTSLGPFWRNFRLMTSPRESKQQYFCDLRNKFFISKFHQILISIFVSPSIHDIQLWTLLPNLEIMASQKK